MAKEEVRNSQAMIAALRILQEAEAKLLFSSQAVAAKQDEVEFHSSQALQNIAGCETKRHSAELGWKLYDEQRSSWLTANKDLPEFTAFTQFFIDHTSRHTPSADIDNILTEGSPATNNGGVEASSEKVRLLESMIALSKQATSLLEVELLNAKNNVSLAERKAELRLSQKTWQDAVEEYERLSAVAGAAHLEVINAEETLQQASPRTAAINAEAFVDPSTSEPNPLRRLRWQCLRQKCINYPSGVWSQHISDELRAIHEECKPLMQILDWADHMLSCKEGTEFYSLFTKLLKRVLCWETSQINLYFDHDEEAQGRYARMKEVYEATTGKGRNQAIMYN